MTVYNKLYINGKWVMPKGKGHSEVVNPATEEISAKVPTGNVDDVDDAVKVATFVADVDTEKK